MPVDVTQCTVDVALTIIDLFLLRVDLVVTLSVSLSSHRCPPGPLGRLVWVGESIISALDRAAAWEIKRKMLNLKGNGLASLQLQQQVAAAE
jgi:hypothetical protein